jgi:uncharacterized protein
LHERQFQFEWDDVKAAGNVLKHGVSFDLACTVFNDLFLLTVADLEHAESEARWLSIGRSGNGAMLSVIYLWTEVGPATTKIRIISARKATQTELHQYEDGQ